MNRNKFIKNLAGIAALPFIPSIFKGMAPDISISYGHDTHGEAFYFGEGEYRRGLHLVYNRTTNEVDQYFFFNDGNTLKIEPLLHPITTK